MGYLIAEMSFALLVTAILGILVGWLAKGLLAWRRQQAEEKNWRLELRRSEARAGDLKNQLAEASLVEERLRDELSQAAVPVTEDADPQQAQSLEAELGRRDKKIELLELQLSQSEAGLASEWESLKALKLEIADRQRRLDERGKQVSGKLRSSEESGQQLRLQLRSMRRREERLQEELKASQQALKEARQTSAARIARLESKLKKNETMIAVLSADETPVVPPTVEPPIATEEPSVEASTNVPMAVEAPPEAAPPEAAPPEAAPPDDLPSQDMPPDDLRRIRGIGPVLERKLTDIGVTRFQQIAAWTDDDLVSVARRIGVGAGRIRKGGWVESARELQG